MNSNTDMKETLAEVIDSLGVEKKMKAFRLTALWPEIVGREIDRLTKVIKIEGETLFIACANSAFAHEFNLMKRDIMNEVNREYPEGKISDIRFSAGMVNAKKKTQNVYNLKDDVIFAGSMDHVNLEKLHDRWKKNYEERKKAGWKECESCGVLIENGNKCEHCLRGIG